MSVTTTTNYGSTWPNTGTFVPATGGWDTLWHDGVWVAHDAEWEILVFFDSELAARRHAMAEDLEVTRLLMGVPYLHPGVDG